MDEIEKDGFFDEEFSLKVDNKQTPLRLDLFLLNRMMNVTRNKIQNAIKNKIVKVNGQEVKPNYKIRPGDIITGLIPRRRESVGEITPENIPLEIIYEDDNVMVINKPAGLVVHPGISNYSGTLVNALKYYFGTKKLPVMDGNDEDRPGIVHRIDKDTTGLLLIAKNDESITKLAKQFFDHSIEREYWALVWGNFEQTEGTIDNNIGRHPKDRKKMTVFPEGLFGKSAITHFKVLEDMYYVSLVSCKLETGRTHQIRVHMQSIGHPVFNDETYGGKKIVKGTVFTKYRQFVENNFKLLPGHALHARSIGFIHPTSGEKMYFEAPLPENFSKVLEKWRTYVSAKKDY
ncbi:MAG TPA: RluA family pseudouridine synthase [Bacteroidetes bacterium]|nr:RluA family pseudouridine synthase [Bacteroidota bacterium]